MKQQASPMVVALAIIAVLLVVGAVWMVTKSKAPPLNENAQATQPELNLGTAPKAGIPQSTGGTSQ